MTKYRPRTIDQLLGKKLRSTGAVLIEGPKWCGKTTTAEQASSSAIYLDDPKDVKNNILMSELSPERILDGEVPRLIDEWPIAPRLWDAIRHRVDHQKGRGQFILTGSSVPADLSGTMHSGTGRFAWITMRPMSLYESGDSTGEVSLNDLFGSGAVSGYSGMTVERLSFLACRGGWPEAVDLDEDVALEPAVNYVEGIIRNDIHRVDGIPKDRQRVRMLMRSYARNQGSQAPLSRLASDISSSGTVKISDETVGKYVSALKMLFVVEDLPAWNPNLRSRTAMRTSDTRYFVDPSVAAASLGIGPDDLAGDPHTLGFILETMAVRDLRIYAQPLGGDVYRYRDNIGNECDAVIHLRDGRYGLAEIKLGGERQIEEGAASLKRVLGRIDTDRMGEPSFMAVITGTGGLAHRRDDGIYVVPIGCLRD